MTLPILSRGWMCVLLVCAWAGGEQKGAHPFQPSDVSCTPFGMAIFFER